MIFCIICGFVNIDCERTFSIIDYEISILQATILRQSRSTVIYMIYIVTLTVLSVVILMSGTVCRPML